MGSYTEQIYGWKMFAIFTGFPGLIGYTFSLTLPCYLIGTIFAYALISWPNPELPIVYRKVSLIVYTVCLLIYIIIFLSQDKSLKFSIYSSTLYVTFNANLGIFNVFYFWD